MRLISELH